jgi:Homeodomain-like domain
MAAFPSGYTALRHKPADGRPTGGTDALSAQAASKQWKGLQFEGELQAAGEGPVRVATNRRRPDAADAGADGATDRRGLIDAPRSGKPAHYQPAAEQRILAAVDAPPPAGYRRWDGTLLARYLGDISKHQIWRVLHAHEISLARRRRWCLSTDPSFAQKAADVVGLYLRHPSFGISQLLRSFLQHREERGNTLEGCFDMLAPAMARGHPQSRLAGMPGLPRHRVQQ